MRSSTRTCVSPECKSSNKWVYARGLCGACYNQARRMVERGVTSWEELERFGLSEATNKGTESTLLIALEKARSNGNRRKIK
jgi:hypothetical protein